MAASSWGLKQTYFDNKAFLEFSKTFPVESEMKKYFFTLFYYTTMAVALLLFSKIFEMFRQLLTK